MSTSSQRPDRSHTACSIVRREQRCPRRPHRPTGHLTALGLEITATRLRVLGHPARLRIIRALDGRTATVEQLAAELKLNLAAVRAHVRLLYRAGVLCRMGDPGPPGFQLADWPSLWLIDQFARRLREQAGAITADDSGEEPVCD